MIKFQIQNYSIIKTGFIFVFSSLTWKLLLYFIFVTHNFEQVIMFLNKRIISVFLY